MNRDRTHRAARWSRLFLLLAVATAPLVGTGCDGSGLQNLASALNSGGGYGGGYGGLGGSTGGYGNNFNSPGYSPLGGGGGYGGLNTPGVGTNNPSGVLPPPAAATGQAAQILQAYSIRVTGSNATPQILDTVARGLKHYSVANTRGIRQINVLSSNGSITGMWKSSGGSAEIDLYARPGGQEPVKLRTVTHEIGHHWTLLNDRASGDAFDQALGESAAGYVSPYARTNRSDKLAEAVAYMLVGPQEFSKEMSILPGWSPSPAAIQIVQQKIIAGR